jgi:hypothetical protein
MNTTWNLKEIERNKRLYEIGGFSGSGPASSFIRRYVNILRRYGFMEIGRDIKFAVPWCLLVGSLGALIMTFSALFHMILISRDRKYEAGQYHHVLTMNICNVITFYTIYFNKAFVYEYNMELKGNRKKQEAL